MKLINKILSSLFIIHYNVSLLSKLGLPSGLFPSGIPTKTLYASPPLSYSCLSPNTIGRGVRIMQHLIKQFSPVSCYFLSPKSTYLSRHSVCSSTPFFPECQKLKISHVYNKLISKPFKCNHLPAVLDKSLSVLITHSGNHIKNISHIFIHLEHLNVKARSCHDSVHIPAFKYTVQCTVIHWSVEVTTRIHTLYLQPRFQG